MTRPLTKTIANPQNKLIFYDGTMMIDGSGRSSLTNEKDHNYFLNRFVCVGEFFDG